MPEKTIIFGTVVISGLEYQESYYGCQRSSQTEQDYSFFFRAQNFSFLKFLAKISKNFPSCFCLPKISKNFKTRLKIFRRFAAIFPSKNFFAASRRFFLPKKFSPLRGDFSFKKFPHFAANFDSKMCLQD